MWQLLIETKLYTSTWKQIVTNVGLSIHRQQEEGKYNIGMLEAFLATP